MTLPEILAALEALGTEQTRRTHARHGNTMPLYGVKVGDMKPLVKKVKGDNTLVRALLDTGNVDAMYLAGLAGDGAALSEDELSRWLGGATFSMISGSTIPWLASEHPRGWALGLRWIDDARDHVQSAGWATLSAWVSTQPDSALDLAALRGLLDRVVRTLYQAPNRTRYSMNNFVLCVGSYVAPLLPDARAAAAALGRVEVDMGDTECKVPEAQSYLDKIEAMGRIGKKRKTARC